ncbi:flagellar hook-associated protein FlgK [Halanaerobium salsuginis]|uniref:Flagellar hook-associated protein 1 n=1 Tax=Halanaerobium salsuginis TaxID=29563 RepID=A0A1I4FWG6_9FIRM|nr:flagellar hook-associated protein FlgK [Halanaerobium salsuginis]SFL22174.1 flagellar hook-associated protein 1 FlgK [Halanaerobium salsuginis]
MSNIFSGLNIGLRALETQRKSLDVTGHNIANANNTSYNKQRAIHKASTPYTSPALTNSNSAGQMGTGVEISQIERVKDQFINAQIFKENQGAGYWEELQRGLEKVEYIFNEPSESGVDTAINEFWNSLQDLSNNPSDSAARNMVRENAYNLIDSMQSVENQLLDYKESINDNLTNAVTDVNELSAKIANLNKQIVSVKGSGQNPNDLMDERDALYKEMNQLINVQGREDAQGNLIVSTNGLQLVNGSDAYDLEVVPGEPGKFNASIIHSRTKTEIEPTNGKMAAWLEMRDEKLDFYKGRLNKMAATMVEEFNQQHQAGYDLNGDQGAKFFKDINPNSTKSAVAQLALTDEIADVATGLDKIAAGNGSESDSVVKVNTLGNSLNGNYEVDVVPNGSQYDLIVTNPETGNTTTATVALGDKVGFTIGANGDLTVNNSSPEFELTAQGEGDSEVSLEYNNGSGANANQLANLFDKGEIIEGTSIESYFRTIVTSVGAESSRAQKMQDNQDVVLKQLETLDRSVSGVSLDEEMANLIKYQQSYAAAAKYITKTDQLLETLMTIV